MFFDNKNNIFIFLLTLSTKLEMLGKRNSRKIYDLTYKIFLDHLS